MSIFRIDYENGNNNRGGDSWNVTFTNADGQTYGTTKFTSALGGFTGLINRYIYIASTTPFWGRIVSVVSDTEVTLSGTIAIQVGVSFWIGGAWQNITSGATAARITPGDTIRIAKSSDPTSLGINGTWTNAPTTLPTSKNIVSSTNASPISININGHSYVTGDMIYIQNHTVNLTANGTWTITWIDNNNFTLDNSIGIAVGGATGNCTKINSRCIKLDSALTQSITRCEQLWTVVNASTVTLETSQYKEGDASAKIAKGSPANNTLYAYFAISELNLSGYQKISFWIRNDQVITTNQWQLCLCSDNAGATPVDTIVIPAIVSTGRWICLTLVGNNVNLGASVQSIALYSGASSGTTTGIYLDNIIACTTSGLNLQSLLSKNSLAQGGTEGFYGIQSISEDGKVIRIDNDTNTLANANITTRGGGYFGVSETVITYKRETIKTSLASSSSTVVQECQESGTLGNLESYEGGYNISSDTQDGETFFDGLNGNGYGLQISSKSYISINRLSFSRYNYGIYFTGCSLLTINIVANLSNHTNHGLYLSSTTNTIINTLSNLINNTGYGLDINNSSSNIITLINNINNNLGSMALFYSNSHNNIITTIININNNYTVGNGAFYLIYSFFNIIVSISNINYNGGCGIYLDTSGDNKIFSLSTIGNASGAIISNYGKNYLRNALIAESTIFSSAINFANSRLFSEKHNQTPDNHYIYTDGGNIVSDATANRHTLSGICWKLSPTSVNRSSTYPLNLSIAKIACVANKLVTVKAWFKVTNITDIYGKLVLRGGQIVGDANCSVGTSIATSNINTNYEELTITFTPSEAGVVEIEAWAYWTLNAADESVYVDDLTITQAD